MKNEIAVADRLIICNINNNMARKTTLCVFLLLGNLLQISAADVEQPAKRPVLGLGIVAGVAVADDPTGYSPAFSDFFTPSAISG